jgi:hypothetical protein
MTDLIPGSSDALPGGGIPGAIVSSSGVVDTNGVQWQPDDADTANAFRARLDRATTYAPSPGAAIREEFAAPASQNGNPTKGVLSQLPKGVELDLGEDLIPPRWLVKNTVLEKGIGTVVGQSGTGKTTAVSHLATCIATARPFFGRKIKQRCGVLYYAAEGGGQIRQRMRAARMNVGIPDKEVIPLLWTQDSYNLNDDMELDTFIKKAKETSEFFHATFNIRLGLVLIDTIVKAFSIRDENDNAEIHLICKRLQLITDRVECFTMGVVHAGKDADKGPRGGSAWRGDVDCSLMATGVRDEKTGLCSDTKLAQTKNRDGPEGPISAYKLATIQLGIDDDGEPFFAPVIEELLEQAPIAKSAPPKRLKGQKAEFMKVVKWALDEAGETMPGTGQQPFNTKGVRREALKKYAKNKSFMEGSTPETQRTNLNKWLRDLAGDGHLHQDEEWVWL